MEVLDADRARVRAPGLRERTARGAMLNSAFLIALELLRTTRGFVIAAIIAVEEFGLFAILGALLGTLYGLRSIGISDRFIQQAEADQERAFQRALTLELAVGMVFVVIFAAAAPLLGAAFDEPRLVGLTLILATIPLAVALQAPQWVFYRRMDFLRQRLLQAVDPLVAFTVSVGLALAGLGATAIVLGLAAGVWASAAAALAACPYRLRLSFDRAVARQYASFSWPLFVGSASAVAMAYATTLVGYAVVGVAGVAAIALATSLIQYTRRADEIVTGTMYPAICAIQDRPAVLAEAFAKSNRLVMLWAFPAGAGLALFGPTLVPDLLGRKWIDVTILIQTFALAAAADQVAFNWMAFYRARGETRPIAVQGVLGAGAYLLLGVPMLAIWGLEGLAGGILVSTVVALAVRMVYVRRLFPDLAIAALVGRAVLPVALASAAVLGLRHGLGAGGIELEVAAFCAVFAATAWLGERELLREARGYLLGRGAVIPAGT